MIRPPSSLESRMVVSAGNVWEDVAPLHTRGLSDAHRKVLIEGSGLDPDIIEGRGYHSLRRDQVFELVNLNVVAQMALQAAGWLAIPIIRPDGQKHGEILRLFGVAESYKYLWPNGVRLAFDVHPEFRWMLEDPTIPLVLTEGIKKADAILSAARREGMSLVTVAANGCYGWRNTVNGAQLATSDFHDIAWKDRRTFVVSDSDFRTNDSVAAGWSACASYIAGKTGPHRTFLVVVPPLGIAKQGADDYLMAGHSVESLLEHAQTPRHAALDVEPERVPLKTKTGLQLIKEAGDKIPHLISPLLPEQAIMVLAGHTGTYKTWTMLSMALDGAFGFVWQDHPGLKAESGSFTTLYVNKEMGASILGQRLKLLARAKRYSDIPDWEKIIEERVIFTDETSLDLNLQRHRDRLEDAIMTTGAKLVVLDSLSMCWHGDENSASEVGAFYAELRGIIERTGCAISMIHHLLKPSNTKKKDPILFSIRGSGQLIQQADAAVVMEHYTSDTEEDETRLIACTHAKARTSKELDAWVLRFSMNDGLFASMLHQGSLADAKARTYAKSPGSIERLQEWLVEELVRMPAMRPTGAGIRFKPLVVLLQQSWSVEDKDPPSEQQIRRQIQALVEQGKLELIEESKRHGNLYRLSDPSEAPVSTSEPEDQDGGES